MQYTVVEYLLGILACAVVTFLACFSAGIGFNLINRLFKKRSEKK